MRLTESPQALPGSCMLCGSGNRKLYVDTGFSIEFHGAVYLCVDHCVNLMAGMAMFLSPQRYSELIEENEHLKDTLFQDQKKFDGLEKAFHGLATSRGIIDPDDLLASIRSEFIFASEKSPTEGNRMGEGAISTSEPSDDKNVGGLRSGSDKREFEFDL